MKIAYITSRQIRFVDGVVKKIKTQIDCWAHRGHKVHVYCTLPRSVESHASNSILPDNIYTYKQPTFLPYINTWMPRGKLVTDLENFRPDIVYMRFEPFRLYHSSIAKRFRIIMELNTDDLTEMQLLAKHSYRTKLNYCHHRLTRNVLFSNISGLVSVTHEIINNHPVKKFHKPSVVIPNGIELSDFPILARNKTNVLPALVFMGINNYEWHGVDKVIRLAKLAKGDLVIHVVGLDRPNLEIPDNIIFHGFLLRSKYEKVLHESDVAIGTLALHRKNMNEACPLKVREYLAYGLPVIIGYNDTAFIGRDRPPWLLQIPNEENNIENNLNLIIKFARKMRGRTVPRNEVEKYINATSLEDKRLNFFERIKNGSSHGSVLLS